MVSQYKSSLSQLLYPIYFIPSRQLDSSTFIKKHNIPPHFRLFPKESCLKVKFNPFSFASIVIVLAKNLSKMRLSAGLQLVFKLLRQTICHFPIKPGEINSWFSASFLYPIF